ncbi:MAG: hypothetical protein AB8E15_00950 [Bdellovibrionales bacterium]
MRKLLIGLCVLGMASPVMAKGGKGGKTTATTAKSGAKAATARNEVRVERGSKVVSLESKRKLQELMNLEGKSLLTKLGMNPTTGRFDKQSKSLIKNVAREMGIRFTSKRSQERVGNGELIIQERSFMGLLKEPATANMTASLLLGAQHGNAIAKPLLLELVVSRVVNRNRTQINAENTADFLKTGHVANLANEGLTLFTILNGSKGKNNKWEASQVENLVQSVNLVYSNFQKAFIGTQAEKFKNAILDAEVTMNGLRNRAEARTRVEDKAKCKKAA